MTQTQTSLFDSAPALDQRSIQQPAQQLTQQSTQQPNLPATEAPPQSLQQIPVAIASETKSGESAASTKTSGTVRWFNDHKGFGYITSPGLKTDAFVHYTEIDAEGPVSLVAGQPVEFELSEGPKGWIASRVAAKT